MDFYIHLGPCLRHKVEVVNYIFIFALLFTVIEDVTLIVVVNLVVVAAFVTPRPPWQDANYARGINFV